ncbi:MAG: hypothetical protein HYZ49_11795 [Chloroflexi bacterium]|nr:hypothetical protein [Chloroflexota bacterium]
MGVISGSISATFRATTPALWVSALFAGFFASLQALSISRKLRWILSWIAASVISLLLNLTMFEYVLSFSAVIAERAVVLKNQLPEFVYYNVKNIVIGALGIPASAFIMAFITGVAVALFLFDYQPRGNS